jgi:hypothetical protein
MGRRLLRHDAGLLSRNFHIRAARRSAMNSDFEFKFGRGGELRGKGIRGLVALGLILVAVVLISAPAANSALSAVVKLFGDRTQALRLPMTQRPPFLAVASNGHVECSLHDPLPPPQDSTKCQIPPRPWSDRHPILAHHLDDGCWDVLVGIPKPSTGERIDVAVGLTTVGNFTGSLGWLLKQS